MMKNKIIASVLAAEMILCSVLQSVCVVFAVQNTVRISSVSDFTEFAENCSLDSYSDGLTAVLTEDLDFSGENFVPVPIFGGTFDGNGHTISGVNITAKGSYQGVFRYVSENGKVSNLNVKGTVEPGGSKSFIGGITGENSGLIENCSFEGTVKGENVIGGIAGENSDTGRITACNAWGNVTGENSTGGIAGKNSGFISNSANNAAVNTVYEEKKNSITDIDTDTGAIIENYKNIEEENEEESVLGHSDTGGITGYTSGIIQGCQNYADVGYSHIGYNVGGVAGRQSGYILGCQNYGEIAGRKDVGGIVGQAEPYILLNASESILRDLRTELNNLNGMVNRFITDTDNLGDDAAVYLTGIFDYAKSAQDNTETLINQGTDFIDDNLSEINAQAAVISNTLDKLVPVFDALESGGSDLTESLEKIADTLDDMKIYAPKIGDEVDDIKDAIDEISKAEKSIKKSVSKLKDAKKDSAEAIIFEDEEAVKTAVSDISAALSEIAEQKTNISDAIDEIKRILASKPEDFEGLGINAEKVKEELDNIKGNLLTAVNAIRTINTNVVIIGANTRISLDGLKAAATDMKDAAGYLSDSAHYTAVGLKDLGKGLLDVSDELLYYADDAVSELKKTTKNLSDGITLMSYAADDIKSALSDMKVIIEDLSNEEPLEFVKLGDDFRNASEGLFDSLSGISDQIDGLKNVISSGRKTIKNDLSSINNQFNIVMNLIIGEFENLQNGTNTLEDIFVDVSDEDIESARQGKIADCENFGNVSADRNTGGVAGAMAIEYSKDPEDDIEKTTTLNFTYRSRAVLETCVNDGKVTGKKDCTGGIVGNAEIGTVYKCENYGDTESTGGNYIGGIVGKCDSAIRKCYAKSKVTGKRYVGGIAGKADTITASYSIVSVTGDENLGAICGDSAANADIYGCYFVSSGVGAADGISYAGKAEPIEFEELKNISGIPLRFISFTVTFVADDEIVGEQDIKYGEDTARIKYPTAPEKKGHFAKWRKPDAQTVTENIEVVCDYEPYITVLSSSEKNVNGKLSLALAEGEFTDESELHVRENTKCSLPSHEGNVKAYDVILKNTSVGDTDKVTLRMLNENKDKVTAWVLKNGDWEKVKVRERGKYVLLENVGPKGTICLRYEDKGLMVLWIVFGVIIILGIVAFTVLKKRGIKIKFNRKR